MKQQVLVVGGAGYIGSHMAMALQAEGYDPIVFDNLSTGHREFLQFGRHVTGDMASPQDLNAVFDKNNITTVMHFAAFINVGESVTNPGKYYRNNIINTHNLLEAALAHDVRHFVFSSTCAIYGEPQKLPLTEDHPTNPINPYGRTKLAVEWMLDDFSRAYNFTYTALRYFNAAGAAPADRGARIGEWHEPETHLIPLILQAALDPEKEIRILGTDYDTPDGTCIRDYIHVCDLADAHTLAMKRLLAGEPCAAYNLGNGQGYSVREVIDCAKEVTGKDIRVVEQARRPGDPPRLVGDSSLAVRELGWSPKFAELPRMIETAWDWERMRRQG